MGLKSLLLYIKHMNNVKLSQLCNDLFEVKEFWKSVTSPYTHYRLEYSGVIKILADERVIETVRKYDGKAAEEVAYWLGAAAYELKDRNAVIEISKILALDEVVDTVRKYDGKAAEEVARWLSEAAYNLKDKDAVVEISRTVRKYDGETAVEVAYWLGAAAYYLKDRNAVIEISRTVRKYDGVTAEEVAHRLGEAAYNLMDRNKVIRIIKMLEKVGKSMFDIINYDEIYQILNENIDNLVKDRKSFDAVAAYVKSKGKLPKPNKNNINNYNKVALDYVKANYGIAKDIAMNQILMLFSLDERNINEVIDLVNKSKEKNVKIYSLGDDSSSLNYLKYSRDELMKYAIISVVGSRNKDLERQAIDAISKIVGHKVINKARNEFYSKYKHLMKEIILAFNQKDYIKACDILKKTENEAIMDVISSADYKDVDISSARFIRAVESKNPLDYDNRVQIACVYLPRSRDILEYCRDDNFVLVRYDIGNQTLGSAICYMEDGIFLVDSVEGHRRFRKPEIFEIVYNDLIERAKERGASMVVFNKNALNKTSKEFLDYLKTKNLPEEIVNMELDTEGYLEADEDGVNGYVVRI